MPLYAFTCGVCGPFEVRRSISRLGEPVSCPTCAGPGKRVFTPPGVRQVSAPLRRAKDLEEKSADQPAVVGERTGRPMPQRHSPTPPWVLGH